MTLRILLGMAEERDDVKKRREVGILRHTAAFAQ